MTARQVHPAAAVWPMLPDSDLRSLADDIAANGLRDPIAVNASGEVIDGRNRLAACDLAGVEPRFQIIEISDATDVAAFVLSRNAERRHMTPSAVAAAKAKTLGLAGLREGGRWKRGTTRIHESVNRAIENAMSKSGLVLDEAPELLDQVIAGTESLDAAYTEAQKRKQTRESADAKMADLDERYPDLSTRVRAGELTLAMAIGEANERDQECKRAIAAGHRAASGYRMEVIGGAAIVLEANAYGAGIDLAPLIAVLGEALTALKNGASK